MRHLRPPKILTGAAAALLVIVGAAATSDDENLRRLAAMPHERRNLLWDRIHEFDLLDRAEQDAIRRLDAQIAEEPDETRLGDLAVLRRFHFWLRRLPEAQRIQLNSSSPGERFKLVEKFIEEQNAGSPQRIAYSRLADFGSASPLVVAYQIKLWMAIPDSEKEALRKLPEPERRKRLDHLTTELKPSPVRGPGRVAIDSLLPRFSKSRLYPFMKKQEDAKKDELVRERFLDHFYFIENPPKKVAPDRLLKFDAALPFWIRSGFDSLPPEEARRRLTILYRLVFNDEEMPDPKPKSPTGSSAPQKPVAPGKNTTKSAAGTPSPF